MRDAQRAVKAIAVGFAILLVYGIIVSVLGAGMIVGQIFGVEQGAAEEWSETVISDKGDFAELCVNVGSVNVRMERGEEFQVWADNEVVEFRRDTDKVYIEEKDFDWLSRREKWGGEVKIILPEDLELERVNLEAGAGTVLVNDLKVKELDMNLGVGRAELNGVEVTQKTKVDGGAGLLVIRDAEFEKLDLDMGVGKVEIEVEISGKSKIDAGLGKLELNLKGGREDYKMKFSKGLGVITLDGENMNDGAVWGDGENEIEIDGGVGAIEIHMI